jgi:hypothetical protein
MNQLPKIAVSRLRQVTTGGHPDADSLTAFAERSLTAQEQEGVLAHLASCAVCRDIITLALPSSEEGQPIPARTGARPSQWRVWQWGAVTASVVVIAGAVWLNRDLREQSRGPSEPHSDMAKNVPMPVAPAVPVEPQARSEGLVEKASANKADSGPVLGSLARKSASRKEVEPKSAVGKLKYQTLPNQELDQLGLRASESGGPKLEESKGPAAGAPHDVSAAASAAPAAAKVAANSQVSANNAAQPAEERQKAASPSGMFVSAQRMAVPPPSLQKKIGKTARDERAESAVYPYSLADSSTQSVQIAQSAYAGAQVIVAKDSVPATMRLTADGELQERSDSATSRWQSLDVKKGDKLRVIALRGQEIWVGGEQGLLYRSMDSGKNWKQVDPGTRGKRIVELRFRDLQHGELKTQNGEIWHTEDGGNTWAKQS